MLYVLFQENGEGINENINYLKSVKVSVKIIIISFGTHFLLVKIVVNSRDNATKFQAIFVFNVYIFIAY